MAELTRFYNTFQPNHYDIYLDIDRSSKKLVGNNDFRGSANFKNSPASEGFVC